MHAKKSRKKSRKNLWQDAAFREKIEAAIKEGALLKGIDGLLRKLNAGIKDPKDAITRKDLQSRLDKLVWTSDRLKLLRTYVRLGKGLEVVYKHFHFLTKELVDKEAKKQGGRSIRFGEFMAPSQAGVNRLLVDSEIGEGKIVELPETTREKPFEIKVKDPDNFSFYDLQGAAIGLKYGHILDENISHNLLFLAEKNGADCVFLTGGMFFVETKRASGSGLMAHRARMSGYNFKAEVIAKEYRDEAKRIRSGKEPNAIVYETLRERYLNLVRGYGKIAAGTKVPIYVTLSRGEEEMIEAAADAEVAYKNAVKRLEIQAWIKVKLDELSYALGAYGDGPEAETVRSEIRDLQSNLARTRITNTSPIDHQLCVARVRSWVIKCYEEAVPSAKVIAHGTAVVSMGGKTIRIKQDRDEKPTDKLLHEFLLDEAGRRTLDDSLCDVELLASAHSLQHRGGVAERWDDKGRTSTYVFQLPVAIDRKIVEEQTRDVIRKGSPLERLLRDPHFEPGAFALHFKRGANGRDMWIPENISMEMLLKLRRPKRLNGGPRYIYIALAGDRHVSHRWKHFFYDKKNNRWLSLGSAFAELMRRHYISKGKLVPIHGEADLGDDLQAHNFRTENQPHEKSKIYKEIEREFGAIRRAAQAAGTKESALAKLDEIHDKALFQMRHKGEDWPQHQFDEFIEDLRPNIDYYLSILRRCRRAGVKFAGVGPVSSGEEDTRDIGAITRLGGDHFGWTVFGLLVESCLYLHFFRSELAKAAANGEFSDDDLKRLVKAPVWGNKPCGIGLVSAPGGYEWGLYLRHEPAEVGGKNGDRMLPAAKNVLARGNFPGIFRGKKVACCSGGIHRYFLAVMRMIYCFSNASETDADPYSEKGWSPNNTGMTVIGLPVMGPEYGPVKWIPFNHDMIRELLLHPEFKFDFDGIFGDAI